MQIGRRIQMEAFRGGGSRTRWWWVTAEVGEAGIRYVDYEPGGRRKLPGPAVMVDEEALREACYEAVRLADGWVGRGRRGWRPAGRTSRMMAIVIDERPAGDGGMQGGR